MKTLLTLAAAAAMAAPLAMAQEDLMAPAYGNTVTIDVQGFWQGKMFIDPDGTYTQDSTDGHARGTWKREGDQHCFTQTEPAAPPSCSPAVARKVGETWEATDSNGITSTVSIVAGREGAPAAPAPAPAPATP